MSYCVYTFCTANSSHQELYTSITIDVFLLLTLSAHAQRGLLYLVCLCVCLLNHISPLERLFILKILSCTQQATEVQKYVWFSLKPLCCGDPALPAEGHIYGQPFFLQKAGMHIIKDHEYF